MTQVSGVCRGWCIAGALIVIILFALAAPVDAGIITLDSTGGDDSSAIMNAIALAGTGGIVILNPGTYYAHNVSVSNSITIQANTSTGAGSGGTIIDAQSLGRIFNVTGGYTLTIDNLTLRNGKAPNGYPATYANPGGTGGSGGCINSDSLVTVTSSYIHDCRAGTGGNGYPGPNEMDAGTVGGDGGNGGAIFTSDEAVINATTISYCFAGNGGPYGTYYSGTGATGGMGGAIYSMNNLTVSSSSITDCAAGNAGTSPADGGAGGNGGGIYAANYTYPVSYFNIRFTTITNCSAGKAANAGTTSDDGGNGGSGGGIYSTWPGTVNSSTISNCKATARGTNTGGTAGSDGMGGAYGGFNYGGGLTLENSTLTGNWAPVGGAIGLEGQGHMKVTSSNISLNSASTWGAVYYWGDTLFADSSTFTGNTGGVIEVYTGYLHLNRFFNNTGTTVYCPYDTTMIEAQNNWWGTNSDPSGYKYGNVTYSPWLVLGAIADPSIVNPGQSSAIRANLTFNNIGEDTSADGHVPDAIPFTFALTAGSGTVALSSGRSVSGMNATLFSPLENGISTIRSTVDGQSVYADVIVSVIASFTGTPVSGQAPLAVRFNDTSGSSTLLSWNWSYGDGIWFNTSDPLQSNATHTYSSPGVYTVSLTIADAATSNTSTRADYISVLIPPPSVTGITPSTGLNTTSVRITNLAGAYFNTTHTPVSVRLNRTGQPDIPGTGISVVDSTNITCTFNLTGQKGGAWNIIVTNPDGQEGTNASVTFTIIGVIPAPVLTGISPAWGVNTSDTSVTITGTEFNTTIVPVVNLTRTGYANVTLPVVSGTSTSLVRTVPAHTGAGIWDVVVVNPDGKEGKNAGVTFTVIDPDSPPSVTSVSPSSGVNTSSTPVTITGIGFNSTVAPVVNLSRAGYSNVSLNATNMSGISLTAAIPAGLIPGIWNVTVINPDGKEAANVSVTFSVERAPVPYPTVEAGSSDDPMASGRSSSYTASSPGAAAGGTMMFPINEPVTSNAPAAIISVSIVPSDTLGATDIIVADAGAVSLDSLSGRTIAGIYGIELAGVNPSSVSQGTIAFAVSGSWLTAHGLKTSDILIMRNHNGAWTGLPTTFDHQTGDTYYFTAITPGFSYFAITTRVNTTVSATTADDAPAPTVVSTRTAGIPVTVTASPLSVHSVTATKPVTSQTTAVPANGTHSSGSPGIPFLAVVAGIAGICIVAAAVVLYRKKKFDPLG
ncbi:MAG: PGF-pre-PGF domain-containing protein [Methanoregulaceae archaeon]